MEEIIVEVNSAFHTFVESQREQFSPKLSLGLLALHIFSKFSTNEKNAAWYSALIVLGTKE